MNIFEFQDNVRSLASDFERLKEDAVRIAAPDITAIVIEQQVLGRNINDSLIKPELASKYYADNKKKKGGEAPFRTPDMHLTGETHRTLELFTTGSDYDFKAGTRHFNFLRTNYPDVWGVSTKNLSEAWGYTMGNLGTLINKRFK